MIAGDNFVDVFLRGIPQCIEDGEMGYFFHLWEVLFSEGAGAAVISGESRLSIAIDQSPVAN
jgi:hypothetical protein